MSEPFVARQAGEADAAGPPSAARRAPVLPAHPLLDPLASHLGDARITDAFLNGPDRLYIDRGEGAVRVKQWRATEAEVRELAVALVSLGGRHVDDGAPCVDVRLESGARVHAVLPPVSTAGTLVSIRIPRLVAPTLADLERGGTMPAAARAWIEGLVARRENVLITGAAGSGKTTLLSAMLAVAPERDRIVTIEDVAELRVTHPHHVALEARQPNLEGAGGIGLARLVREALRMRPDRLVVGECRGDEVRELLSALNTGHDGGAGTLHANGLDDVPARLEALGALAGLADHALARQAVSAIGWVLHVERDAAGQRRLAGAGRLRIAGERLAIERSVPWE
ncbi:MAG: TadA family conjugal transfer-associated ATPase [Microbacterium sp.]|uniref:TadA family conjugal transfer-associated ATPase n=1 Tax=Microbacterium sp. TaxID=51671 RepID=UPI0039E4DCB0